MFLHADDAARLAPATEAVDAIGVVAAPGVGGDELTAALEGAAGDTPSPSTPAWTPTGSSTPTWEPRAGSC